MRLDKYKIIQSYLWAKSEYEQAEAQELSKWMKMLPNGLEMNLERSKKQEKKQQQEKWFTQVEELVQEN